MSEPRFYILEHSGYIGVTTKTESTEFMVLDREYGHGVVFSRIAPVESMGPRFEQLRRARIAARRARVSEGRASLNAARDSLIRERDGKKFLNLAREDEIVAALERSENDWSFLYNLHPDVPLAPEIRKALAAANLKLIRVGQ